MGANRAPPAAVCGYRKPDRQLQSSLQPLVGDRLHPNERRSRPVCSGLNLMRIAPGKASFACHLHHREEEWIYILSGLGVALIDGGEYDMGPGDFVAFPTPSVAHSMRNHFDEELVYRSGGWHRECEVAGFSELGRRMVRIGEQISIYNLADGRPLFPEEPPA